MAYGGDPGGFALKVKIKLNVWVKKNEKNNITLCRKALIKETASLARGVLCRNLNPPRLTARIHPLLPSPLHYHHPLIEYLFFPSSLLPFSSEDYKPSFSFHLSCLDCLAVSPKDTLSYPRLPDKACLAAHASLYSHGLPAEIIASPLPCCPFFLSFRLARCPSTTLPFFFVSGGCRLVCLVIRPGPSDFLASAARFQPQ
ncbi:hypothetical protein ASPZODRAFT_508799 [Penicilliopsis zonata CBS 506.65]|uniref:Uncharacterized protein n=1 Tax=Penicilliopsis zonata CBS 506.65 TaxID=1073090 RepID=A0A1L9SEI9_9EURO|nr:hypothetical protein ASPZODRAFT_508799 [Penicilliopsis zonata CBS 506.65]OJJ45675.1 hypothetical protein ASPZODRAFT_508799 [Penicilliopsis zonata CBS 506.65]